MPSIPISECHICKPDKWSLLHVSSERYICSCGKLITHVLARKEDIYKYQKPLMEKEVEYVEIDMEQAESETLDLIA